MTATMTMTSTRTRVDRLARLQLAVREAWDAVQAASADEYAKRVGDWLDAEHDHLLALIDAKFHPEAR